MHDANQQEIAQTSTYTNRHYLRFNETRRPDWLRIHRPSRPGSGKIKWPNAGIWWVGVNKVMMNLQSAHFPYFPSGFYRNSSRGRRSNLNNCYQTWEKRVMIKTHGLKSRYCMNRKFKAKETKRVWRRNSSGKQQTPGQNTTHTFTHRTKSGALQPSTAHWICEDWTKCPRCPLFPKNCPTFWKMEQEHFSLYFVTVS